jgi:hypothetical protein
MMEGREGLNYDWENGPFGCGIPQYIVVYVHVCVLLLIVAVPLCMGC